MSLSKSIQNIRTSVLIGTIVISAGGQAFASAACDAINAGAFVDQSCCGPASSSTRSVSGLLVGERITIGIRRGSFGLGAPPVTWTLLSGDNTVVATTSSNVNGFELQSYTVTGRHGDTTLTQRLAGGANVETSSVCTPASAPSVRSVQLSASQSVATTSGQIISSAVDSGIADAFAPDGTTPSISPNGTFIGFAAVIEPQSRTVDRAQEAMSALAYAGNMPSFAKAQPRLDREWNLWADIRGTGWRANDTTGVGSDLKGSQLNLTAGLGRKLTPDTLVGVVVGYEYFKYDVAALAGSLKGDGQTIGGYFARRFGGLRFDAGLAWSRMSYSATTDSAFGAFTGSRWLATMGLSSSHRFGSFIVQPSAKLYALWESQPAWTDSSGAVQAARMFSTGRVALGGQAMRPWVIGSGWTVSPYAGLYGDWRFSTDNALPVGLPVGNISNGWSARVTSGLSATALRGASVSVGGELGGLASNYKIWTGNVRATVPF